MLDRSSNAPKLAQKTTPVLRKIFSKSALQNLISKNLLGKSAIIAVTAALTLSGCAQVYKTGANIGLRFAEGQILPPILSLDDVNMVCVSGTSLQPAILATAAMGADATRVAVLMYAGAAMCAEDTALEHELTYLRSAHNGKVEEAEDARIAQKRWSTVAARRQYAAYQMFQETWEREYKVKLGEECPAMKTDLDKTIYLIGLLTGLQAIVNDISSQGAVNVPKDIAAVVERGMKCINNEQFWGVPMAVRASIWVLLPGAGEGKPDPYQTLKDSTRLGERKGVRMSHAVYALAAQATGKDELIRDALKTYGHSVDQNMPVNPKYKLFDAMGGHLVWGIADRYWTDKTGKRAPEDGLTKFWDESSVDSNVKVDDLLN